MTNDDLITECAMKVKPELWGNQQSGPYKGVTLLYIEYMRRRAELINEPDDSAAPDWARWKAQDADGTWSWFEIKPSGTDSSIWVIEGDGYAEEACKGWIPAGHDWKQTLKEVDQMTTTAHEDQFTPSAPTWPLGDAPTRSKMIEQLNRGLAYWPSHFEEAQHIFPVDEPWEWMQGGRAFLARHYSTVVITRDDWNAHEADARRLDAQLADSMGPKYSPEDVAFNSDAINPNHYRAGKIECIDALESATVNKCGIEAICTANAIKYLWRYESKGGLDDVRKARWYLERLEQHLSN